VPQVRAAFWANLAKHLDFSKKGIWGKYDMFCCLYGPSSKRVTSIILIIAAALFTISVSGQNPPPAPQSISPNAGSTNGGTQVTISGANFLSGATVTFGSAAATNVVVVNSNTITAITPANPAGTINVTVTNPDLQSGSLVGTQQPLTNPGFESGMSGWMAGSSGTATVIANDPGTAHSGNNYAQLSVSPSATQVLLFALLGGSSSYLPVNPGDVINFGGWVYRVDTNSSGDGKARWDIEVTDSNHLNAVYVPAVPNNATTASWVQQTASYTIPSGKSFIRFDCQITGITQPAEANCDDAIFTRTIPGGGFTYFAGPTISSISPNSGTSNGGTAVTISGSNFRSAASVTIGGASLSNVVVKSNSITGMTPAHVAGGADVVVTNPDNQSATLTSMLHNQGFEAQNSQWAASGSGSATIVNNVNNAHVGTYYAELSSPVKGNHPVLFAADNSNVPQYFPVNPGDVIMFGGWAYRVSGDGSARWAIEISDVNKKNQVFLAAPPANVQDAQWELQKGTYTVPTGKAFIRLYCEILNNTVPAVARFDDAILQRSPGGTYGYTFISPPMVNSVSPNWGTPAGGTTRTVWGTGFLSGDTVKVGGAAATNVVVNSANAITFFVPPGVAGDANVSVTSPDGQTSPTPTTYTYKNAPAPPTGMTNIHHIIYTMQENRSFDNYFAVMNQFRASNGVNDNAVNDLTVNNGLNTALRDIAGQPVTPFHLTTECVENTQPSWNATHIDYDNGNMDLFMKTGNMFTSASSVDPNGTRAMGYYDSTDLPYYYSLGFQFAISDEWFSPLMGPTGANRAYSFAGTSLGFVATPQPPSGTFPNLTIFDLLDQAGVSWKYYYQNTAPTWIPIWSVYTRDQSNVVPISQYYSDVKSDSTLPQVVFIEENGNLDEHPKPNPGTNGLGQNIQNGANLMSQIIGALMASPAWTSSVFILTWDEGGGIHDHVKPASMALPDGYPPQTIPGQDQPGIFNQAGLRVPLIVVSPWTGPHQVANKVPRDHTSILKLIETRFSLPPLTGRDAAADDMEEFFNFQSPPWLTPPPACKNGNTNACILPQPTTGTCNLNLEKAPGQ
jgi:phospholipase C